MLTNIACILVGTSHPGNIGSAARALKTMGLKELRLVDPKHFPSEKAMEMASGADDLLLRATAYQTFEAAIADCHLVIGTSARSRALPWPLLTPKELASRVMQEPKQHRVAIVFGRERTGLTNEELQQCHYHVIIPANPEYSSLNIAAAVQVIAYELRVAYLEQQSSKELEVSDETPATHLDIVHLFAHLETVMRQIEVIKSSAPRKLMDRLKRLLLRAKPDRTEVNLLRGILTHIQKSTINNHE